MFTIDNMIRGIEKIFRNLKLEQTDGVLTIKRILYNDITAIGTEMPIVGRLRIEEIEKILEEITDDLNFNEFFLNGNNYFEAPVKMYDQLRYSPRYLENENIGVEEYGYKIEWGKASNKYISALLCYIGNNGEQNWDYFSMNSRVSRIETYYSCLGDIFDGFRINTIRINSTAEHSLTEFKKLLNSYIFNIAYNKNIVFNIMDFSGERQVFRNRIRRNGQLFPYNSYNMELVKYYYQAVTSDIPFAQYLAFYHVAEYFFQIIAESEAFQTIESLITHPSFSPRRKEDMRQFYKKIKKVMKDQKDDGVWDEKIGLLLCLKKYIPDIKSLENKINNIDSSAIEYYRSNDVPFATDTKNEKDKIKINFNDTEETLYANIRNRIYLVRNAIAHSKEGEHLRYEPFRHDKELFREIPLIRAVAEEIIINSSKPIEIKN